MLATIKERLRKAGLTENELNIYSCLLEIGAMPAGKISRRTGLHRRVIYDTVERLIQKGIIGYILENNRKIFQAANPSRFLEIIEEEKRQVQEVMPEMLSMFNSAKEKQKEDTLFFRGKNGLKAVFEDQLAEGKEILIVDTSNVAYEMFEIYFHWFDKRRKHGKIPVKIIFNESEKKEKPKIPMAEIKYLPKEYSNPSAINIYGDNVAIIHWNKQNPFVVLIRQKEIADGYRKYFELMWKSAKKQ
jgi:sugar-specific transcriptional regulator TrmB